MKPEQPNRRIGIVLLVALLVVFGVFAFLSSGARHRVLLVPLRGAHSANGGTSFSFPVYIPTPYVPEIIPVPELEIDQSVVTRALCESMPLFSPAPEPLLIHEVRLWGNNTDFSSIFESEDILFRHANSSEMVEWLLNGVENKENIFGTGTAPYLSLSNFGVHVSLIGPDAGSEDRGEAHFGQLAAVSGLAGVKPDRRIITDSGVEKSFSDILNDLISNYCDDHEAEFFAVAMVLYLDAPYIWTDRYGNECSIDSLTRRLVSKKGSSCYGTHVPFAVALALRRDRDEGNVLSTNTRNLAICYLQEVSRDLNSIPLNEESWGDLTNEAAAMIRLAQASDDQRMRQLTILGHHLEWIALADPVCRPSAETICQSVSILNNIIVNLPPMEIRTFKLQLPLSHATRALVSLSGKPLSFHVSQIPRR